MLNGRKLTYFKKEANAWHEVDHMQHFFKRMSHSRRIKINLTSMTSLSILQNKRAFFNEPSLKTSEYNWSIKRGYLPSNKTGRRNETSAARMLPWRDSISYGYGYLNVRSAFKSPVNRDTFIADDPGDNHRWTHVKVDNKVWSFRWLHVTSMTTPFQILYFD